MQFQFYMPTRILAGEGCIRTYSDQLAALGTKAFIMSGKNSAARNGSLKDVCNALESKGISWEHFNGVNPNPSLEEVREAAKTAQKSGADFVIALGGGSPMDAAKAVAVLAAEELSDEELLSRRSFNKVLPLAAVPTTSGTGSEVTPYSILTNTAMETKSLLNSEQIYPRLAFLDGRYTMDLPERVTRATVIDALSHALEGYLAVRAIPPAQSLALECLRIIGPLLSRLSDKTLSLEDREELLYASMLAGIVISQSGTTAVHAMGYSLTYFKGLDHGVANGLLICEYLRFIRKSRQETVDLILTALSVETIDELESLIEPLFTAQTLGEEEIDRFAGIAIKAGNIQNTDPEPVEEDLRTILANCFSARG